MLVGDGGDEDMTVLDGGRRRKGSGRTGEGEEILDTCSSSWVECR